MQIGLYSCRTLARFGDRRYAVLRDAGFDGLDLRINDKVAVIAAFPEDEYMAVVMRHKAMAEEAGIGIFQLHAPWTWPLENGTEDVTVRTEATKKVIRSAVILHCPYVVVHPLMPFGRDEENGKEAETWEANLAFLKDLATYAGSLGVTVCLENMPFKRYSLTLPDATYRMVKAVGDEYLKICLDTGHCAKFKLQPGKVLREIGDEVRTLHVHDNDGEKDLHVLPYFGVSDWEDFGKALIETGYPGTFCLESGAPHPKMDLELMKEMLRFDAMIARSVLNAGTDPRKTE